MSKTKLCRRCQRELPVEDFYVYKTGVRAGQPFYMCKPCKRHNTKIVKQRAKEAKQ